MFDAGRAVAMFWAAGVLARTRIWRGLIPLAVTAYLFGLAVASGIAVRTEGPENPMLSVLLVLVGPTAMPRGHLPALPLVTLVVGWPVLADLVACAAVGAAAWRFMARSDALPSSSKESEGLGRAALALAVVAGFEVLSAALRAVPYVLDWGAGGQGFGELR